MAASFAPLAIVPIAHELGSAASVAALSMSTLLLIHRFDGHVSVRDACRRPPIR